MLPLHFKYFKMNGLFKHFDPKLLGTLNRSALIVTGISEALVIYFFITKTAEPYIERWKYLALLAGLIVVSLLLLLEIGMFIYFLSMKSKQEIEKGNESKSDNIER